MLLLHQIGSVKIGEVVRYTVTYTPSDDRILPSPECLHLRIRNTSLIALRAAFVHGPYQLSVAAYPAHFNPHQKLAHPRRYGVPEFEPMLKAGGYWTCRLLVPDHVRAAAGSAVGGRGSPSPPAASDPSAPSGSVSWVVEVASQILFSTSAAVHYEILLARDEKSLDLGSSGVSVMGGNQAQVPQPGSLSDFQRVATAVAKDHPHHSHHPHRPHQQHHDHQPPAKGVFSRAIGLKVEDTAALWNKPALPGWDVSGRAKQHPAAGTAVEVTGPVGSGTPAADTSEPKSITDAPSDDGPRGAKKVHLVILTHGLHSNLGADMLFMKESIDAAAKQAKADARARRQREREARAQAEGAQPSNRKERSGAQGGDGGGDDDEDVVVRGFSGNATRTERGIKYLGKRLARFILAMTYPDQPFLPASLTAAETVSRALHTSSSAAAKKDSALTPAHKHSTIHKTATAADAASASGRGHRITKISFVGHSLGGLVQLYAIAYVQKHSPQFFDLIEPINFIALASPLLGLNHENPLYVKFALDFGLVGRTGQDLGLTWRAPTIARNGWSALVSNLGEGVRGNADSKPLLRILPTGPAHVALEKFRNRTLYSNVVNDGIVPLRTSCLLFLDWQGLGRVEKARREAGLVETVVGFGWSELLGANAASPRTGSWQATEDDDDDDDQDAPEEGKEGGGVSTPRTVDTTGTGITAAHPDSHEVPQPAGNAILEDDRQSLRSVAAPSWAGISSAAATTSLPPNPFSGFFNLFKGTDGLKKSPAPAPPTPKQSKIYERSQTLLKDGSASSDADSPALSTRSRVTAGPAPEAGEDGAGAGVGTEAGAGAVSSVGGSDSVAGTGSGSGPSRGMSAPPTTTFFEAAGDLLNPKLPSVEYLIDPSKRPRTIFHDRVYHPSDIPPPPLKKRPSAAPSTLALRRKPTSKAAPAKSGPTSGGSASAAPESQSTSSSPFSSPQLPRSESMASSTRDYDDAAAHPGREPGQVVDSSGMRVEEKIARAYHRGLSWRKVLVKLEPDAHNNIVVRRTFANAFGWPVVKHLVDAHFSDSESARAPDSAESNAERAPDARRAGPPDEEGRETETQTRGLDGADSEEGSAGEPREADDRVPALPATGSARRSTSNNWSGSSPSRSGGRGVRKEPQPWLPDHERIDSMTWSERDWEDSADDSDYAGGPLPLRKTAAAGAARSAARASASGDSGDDKEAPAGGSGQLSWNWTEKIVGKGASARSKSPRSPSFPPNSQPPPSASYASAPPSTKGQEPSADSDAAGK